MEAGDWSWCGLVGAGLVIDAILERTDRQLLSESARKHRHLTALAIGALVLHFLDLLGPLDPFRALGRLVTNGQERRSA